MGSSMSKDKNKPIGRMKVVKDFLPLLDELKNARARADVGSMLTKTAAVMGDAQIKRLHEELADYREALEWYAPKMSEFKGLKVDIGKRAREVLAKWENK